MNELPEARAYRPPWVLWVGLLLLAVALLGWIFGGAGTVTAILVTQQGGIPDLTQLINDQPDFYLGLLLKDQRLLKTQAYTNQPIGNGQRWDLQQPIALEDLQEVQLFDQDVIDNDDLLDRVRVDGRQMSGQHYTFQLIGGSTPLRWVAAVSGGIGLVLLLITAIRLARDLLF